MSHPGYSSLKRSNADWIGAIPSHWTEVGLKRRLTLITAKAADEGTKVALENIESGTGRYLSTETEYEGEGTSFQRGDLLFGKLRPYLAKVLLADASGQAVGDFHVLRPSDDLDGRFALYYMLSRDFIAVVDGSTYGAKMPRASWDFMSSLPLPLPPLPEQTAIAAFLDRETGKIDALVEEQKRLIEVLKKKRQAVISHAVTKGLDPNARMKPSGVHWLGDVPEHWDVAALSRIADRVIVGIAEAAAHAYTEEGIPILRSTNLRPGKIRGDLLYLDPAYAKERSSKLINAGDLVTVRTGHAGVTAVVPHELDKCQCFTMLVTTLVPSMNASYVCHWLNSEPAKFYFAAEAWGSAQPNISVPILKAISTPVPPKEEQKKIAAFLEEKIGQIDALEDEAASAVRLLRERRSALISAAVTGKIDVGFIAAREKAA